MEIYAPCSDAEYVSTLGAMTADEFALLESRLKEEIPPLRFLKEPEEGVFPTIPLYTLRIHRDDRDRSHSAIQEVLQRLWPQGFGIRSDDRELAARVRQYVRALEAGDRVAVKLMKRDLTFALESHLNRLLYKSKLGQSVSVWMDGIVAQQVHVVAPLGLLIQGYVYAGRASDGSQWREPFEAELHASHEGDALAQFFARFGDLERLVSEGVIRADVSEDYPLDESVFQVRVGNCVTRREGQLLEWAFEFTKEERAGT